MQIAWAVTCRYAESNGVQGTIVGAGVDVLFVPEFPSQVAIMLAVRLTATPDELRADQQHELVIRIEGPDGQPARTIAGEEVEPLRARMLAATQGAPLVPGEVVPCAVEVW